MRYLGRIYMFMLFSVGGLVWLLIVDIELMFYCGFFYGCVEWEIWVVLEINQGLCIEGIFLVPRINWELTNVEI